MTNYYVRTFTCGPFLGDDYTHNKFLYDFNSTFGRTSEDMMTDGISSQYDGNAENQLYNICASVESHGVILPHAPRNKTTDIHLQKTYQHIEAGYYSIFFYKAGNLETWESYGWTDPQTNYSTWLDEICAFFEEAKVTDSSIYGTDNGEINVYVITWEMFGSDRLFYLPIFRKGSDSHYDSIIEV